MSLRGACACNNLSVTWRTVDYSLVPRACQCGYCRERDVAWVSKSGTFVAIDVARPALHRVQRQGSGQAAFHECANCDGVVAVTAQLEGELFAALNANCLHNPAGFAQPVAMTPGEQSPREKAQRWRSNWCSVARMPELAGGH